MSFEYLQDNGVYYGYPKCCIQSFIEPALKEGRIPNAHERSQLQQKVAKNGFIPCEKHASEISEGKIRIEQLILPSRACPKPFSKGLNLC